MIRGLLPGWQGSPEPKWGKLVVGPEAIGEKGPTIGFR